MGIDIGGNKMSDLKKEMLKIKVKGYFDNGDLRIDPTITALVKYSSC